MKKALKTALLVSGLLALSGPALADTVSLTGTLDGTEPTFDQPISTASVFTSYDTYDFTVDADGMYAFLSFYAGDTTIDENLDGALLLYSGSFDPLNPLANLVPIVSTNDDYQANDLASLAGIGMEGACVGQNCSGFDASLMSGMTYILVQTSFTDMPTSFGQPTGAYDLTITGPGNVDIDGAVIPLPAAAWLLMSGLLGLGAFRRRR